MGPMFLFLVSFEHFFNRHWHTSSTKYELHFTERKDVSSYTTKFVPRKIFVCQLNVKAEKSIFIDVESVKKFVIDKSEIFSKVARLAKFLLTLPVSSVDCERVFFSSQNFIETRPRNRLKMESLERQLTIFMEVPSNVDFNFKEAFRMWTVEPATEMLTFINNSYKSLKRHKGFLN